MVTGKWHRSIGRVVYNHVMYNDSANEIIKSSALTSINIWEPHSIPNPQGGGGVFVADKLIILTRLGGALIMKKILLVYIEQLLDIIYF